MTRYLAIWYDESDLPRAWGSADSQADAETMADIQADEYRQGRPDVRLERRVTHEFLTDDVSVEIANHETR